MKPVSRKKHLKPVNYAEPVKPVKPLKHVNPSKLLKPVTATHDCYHGIRKCFDWKMMMKNNRASQKSHCWL